MISPDRQRQTNR